MTMNRLHLASYNLRFDSMPDGISVADSIAALPGPLEAPKYLRKTGEQPWSTRRMRVAHKILSRAVDILCVQEALIRQLHDLQELLGDEWAWEGAGRDDGKEAGEFSAVFFRKTHLRVQSVDHFWLSETPFKPSQHKSAANIRICTAIRILLNPGTPEENQFVVMNTHLDHQSDLARRFGASLMLHRARHEAAKFGPVLVFGDFNSPPTGSDSGAYAIMTGQRAPAAVPADFAERYPLEDDHSSIQLHDLRGRAPRDRVNGGFATYTDWRSASDPEKWARIDFIFGTGLGKQDHWDVHDYEVDTAVDDDGVLASDHRPVFTHVTLRGA